MGVYENQYGDFPLRVAEIWLNYRENTYNSDRKVTHLMMAAYSGILPAFELLKGELNNEWKLKNRKRIRGVKYQTYKKFYDNRVHSEKYLFTITLI